MVEDLIRLLIMVLLFGGAAWGAYWLVGHLPAPAQTPALIIVTLIFLIILLVAVSNYFGTGLSGKSLFRSMAAWPIRA